MAEKYLDRLVKALEEKRAYLDNEVSTQLKSVFGQIHIAYSAFYQMLLQKGVVKPDQYHADQRIRLIKSPSSKPFAEPNRLYEMSIRLSELDSQYDFLHIVFNLTTDNANFQTIKAISELLRYVEWDKITVSNDHYITQNLAFMIEKLRRDGVSERLLDDAAKQVALYTNQAFYLLQEFSIYVRERYKYALREKCWGQEFQEQSVCSKSLLQLVNEFKVCCEMQVFEFIKDLAVEAAAEICGPDQETLQETALARLKIREIKLEELQKPEAEAPAKPKNIREPLIMAFYELGRLGAVLETLWSKLEADHELYIKANLSFFALIRFKIKQFFGADDFMYRLQGTDPMSGETFMDEVSFKKLNKEIEDEIQFLAHFSEASAPVFKKLEAAPAEQLEEWLIEQSDLLKNILALCSALDEFFKKRIRRGEVKGLKVELAALKRQISRVLELRHEFSVMQEAAAEQAAFNA